MRTAENLHHQLDRVHPSVGVGAMVVREDKVMLARRKGSHGAGSYAWCGGGLEFGESLEDAAVREVQQESGLVVRKVELMCVSNIREYERHYIDFEFLVEASGDPELKEPDSSEPWHWYALDDVPRPLFRPVELALDSYQRRQPGEVIYNP
jgi:8-oxo-dGTP diphosphatase